MQQGRRCSFSSTKGFKMIRVEFQCAGKEAQREGGKVVLLRRLCAEGGGEGGCCVNFLSMRHKAGENRATASEL